MIICSHTVSSSSFEQNKMGTNPRKLIIRVYHAREKLDYRPSVDILSSDSFVSAAQMTIIGNRILCLPKFSCNIVQI